MADTIPTLPPPMALDCTVCGARYEYQKRGPGRLPRFCSDECRSKAPYRARVRHTGRCVRCQKDFIASKPTALYCSLACHESMKRVRKKARGWVRPPQHAYWAKRNARYRAAVIENVDPFVVFERDGWRCQMCGSKTDKSKRGTSHPNSPELDHILPLSRGGEHSYRNTQCSCRKCNMTKGNTPMGQLVLL